MNDERHRCRDCGITTSNLYWTGINGSRMKQPRCQACHEDLIRKGVSEPDIGDRAIDNHKDIVQHKHKMTWEMYREARQRSEEREE